MVILASIIIFIISVVFRLLDNSAGLLIANGISVTPFYLSQDKVEKEIVKLNGEKPELVRKLKRNIWFQKLNKVLNILAIITLVVGVVYEYYNGELVRFF